MGKRDEVNTGNMNHQGEKTKVMILVHNISFTDQLWHF